MLLFLASFSAVAMDLCRAPDGQVAWVLSPNAGIAMKVERAGQRYDLVDASKLLVGDKIVEVRSGAKIQTLSREPRSVESGEQFESTSTCFSFLYRLGLIWHRLFQKSEKLQSTPGASPIAAVESKAGQFRQHSNAAGIPSAAGSSAKSELAQTTIRTSSIGAPSLQSRTESHSTTASRNAARRERPDISGRYRAPTED